MTPTRSKFGHSTGPQRKGGVLRKNGAGRVRPVVRLLLCIAVMTVPVLLLASPGRVTSRAVAGRHRPNPARADGSAVDAQLVDASAPWALPVVLATTQTVTTSTSTPSTASTTASIVPPPQALRRAPVPAATTTTTDPPRTPRYQETGQASWYGARSGTCASPTLAFGTSVTVTDLSTGGSTICTVDDRGPHEDGRIIDLSEGTFAQLADPSTGVIEVRLTW